MNLQRLNLNLLVALEALLATKSVTQAAKKLFITQAAMSNNLKQLRETFKDTLLVCKKSTMVMTPYAKTLYPKVQQILEEIQGLVSKNQQFNPASSERIFKIGLSDYMSSLVLPKLLKLLEKDAPGIKIYVVTADIVGEAEPFENGEYDLALGKVFLTHPNIRPLS